MHRIASAVAVTVLALLTMVAAAAAQDVGMAGGDRYFTLEWQPGERAGKPSVHGSVRNEWGETATYVQLRVDSLDAAGRVTASSMNYFVKMLTPGSRQWFEVPVPAPAATYRVSVLAYDWLQTGGGER